MSRSEYLIERIDSCYGLAMNCIAGMKQEEHERRFLWKARFKVYQFSATQFTRLMKYWLNELKKENKRLEIENELLEMKIGS